MHHQDLALGISEAAIAFIDFRAVGDDDDAGDNTPCTACLMLAMVATVGRMISAMMRS